MEEGTHRSSEALRGTEDEYSNPPKEDEEEVRGQTIGKDDEQRRLSSDVGNDRTENASSGERGESKARELGDLASERLSESGVVIHESTHNLSEVPVEYSLQPLLSVEKTKDQVRATHEESLKGVSGQSAKVQIQHLTRLRDSPSKLELSPTSITQSVSSISSPTSAKHKILRVDNERNPCIIEQDQHNSPKQKPLAYYPILRASFDGYNWRKYGQKIVKSPEGFRSYYRCTFSDCYAKKIDCCDRYHVVETIYKSLHNHDPPRKLNCTRETKVARPIMPINRSDDTTNPMRCPGDPVLSISSKESLLRIDQISETKQLESSGSDEITEANFKDEHVDSPECVNRQKRSSAVELDPLPKPGKKPKFVVHAAGDLGISGDGYRWRKYGQKMVKGNPQPRNYYRCTSAGCAVRKHVEKALDNTNAVVITYKGVHDHDMPVPRKRPGPKCDPRVADTSDSLDNLNSIKEKPYLSQSQLSMDKESDLTSESMNPDAEKTSKPAQTLLSIEFEIKPS